VRHGSVEPVALAVLVSGVVVVHVAGEAGENSTRESKTNKVGGWREVLGLFGCAVFG
jgi:hypothetical protein